MRASELLLPSTFAESVSNGEFQRPPHIRLIEREVFQVLFSDHWDVLVAMCPPRHGKTFYLARWFPTWYFGVYAERNIILTSYGKDLARASSRWVKDATHKYAPIWNREGVNRLVSAATDWQTVEGGGMLAAGIGGGITGRPANIFLIDDVLKNAEHATSSTVRDNQWEWFQSTALTRLEPGGKCIVLACLAGDTAVSMADGTTKAIRDVRAGDAVKTCNGVLESRKVLNHACVGHDNVLKVVLESGREVRGNARHPFMALRQGKLQWIRLRNLRRNDVLITVNPTLTKGKEGSGECMSERLVNGTSQSTTQPEKNVVVSQGLKGTATSTTPCSDGATAIGHRPHATHEVSSPARLSTDMGSLLSNMKRCLKSSAGFVQYAESLRLKERMFSLIRAENFASIIAMKQGYLGDCCATYATLQQDTQEPPPMLIDWLSTSDFTNDRIVSIEPDGFEPVYDIEVEGTGNFIANGIVSHNTRWHSEDLLGRILKFAQDGDSEHRLRVREIRLPALAEPTELTPDPLGRATDEALWPQRYDTDRLKRLRASMDDYWFSAIFQQRLGTYGKNEWPEEYFWGIIAQDDEWPEHFDLLTTAVDPSKGKESRNGDYQAIVSCGYKNGYLWFDADVERRPIPTFVEELVQWNIERRPMVTGIESTQFQELLADSYRLAQAKYNYFDDPELIENTVAKNLRISRIGLWLRYHKVKIRNTQHGRLLIKQLKEFPNSDHDDGPDAMEMSIRLMLRLSDELQSISSDGEFNLTT